MIKAKIYITLKNGVLDPQGSTVSNTLEHMGFSTIASLRQGKFIELSLHETNREKARQDITAMCEQLLANTVIETYHFELEDA